MSHTVTDRRSSVLLGSDGRPMEISTADPQLTVGALAGSFQATDQDGTTGFVYCPTMDSQKEVDAWSRVELAKRAHVLYNSGGGLPQRLIDGTADMICGTGMIPHPTPKRVRGREQKLREWSHNVRRLYMQRCGSRLTYDLSQRRNVQQDQRLAVRLKRLDGDSAKVFVRDVATGRLRTIRYEANQIGNGSAIGTLDKTWIDGIKVGRFNEMQAMRILSVDALGKQTKTDIPAENVLHLMNDQRLRQVRGLTCFYPVLKKMFSRGEIQHALTQGIKVASQPAYVIQQAAAQGNTIPGAAGTTVPGPVRQVEVNGKKVNFRDFLAGGEAWGLGAGQEFKVVQSQSPHPNVADYLREMVRDICHACKIPPEIAWDIIDAGGANMRFIQASLAQWIEIEQDDLIDNDLGPHYVAWLYDMIVAGEVEEVDGWEQHVWIAPARLTVDFGRDGKLYIEELKRGLRSMQSMYGLRGEIAEVGIDTFLDERQYTIQGIIDREITERDGTVRSMTLSEAFPEIGNSNTFGNAIAEASAQAADQQAQQLESMQAKLDDIAHVIAFAREPK